MKRIVIIGGTGNLGRAICTSLHKSGMKLAFTYHQAEDRAAKLQRTLNDSPMMQLDVTDEAAVSKVVPALCQKLGGLDSLIYCPGISDSDAPMQQKIEVINADNWDRVHKVNVRGAYLAARAALPFLKENESGGNLVFTGSIDTVRPLPTPVHYSASKSALQGLCHALAKELGPDKILSNVVAPGLMTKGLSRSIEPAFVKEFKKHSALKRLGEPAEIAAMLCWMATKNTYITGQVISVDGGL